MPFISETLYYALPGKDKMHLTHMKFPEPYEVNLTEFNTLQQ